MRHADQSQSSVNRRLCLSTNQKAIYHRETKPQQVILTLVSSSNCDIIMPFINVETNLPASKFPEDVLKRLCTTLAAALGKPEDVSIVALVMSWFSLHVKCPDLDLKVPPSCNVNVHVFRG